MRTWLVGMLVLLLLAGCLSPAARVSPSADARPVADRTVSVVALVDTGINPYHEAFNSSRGAPPLLVPYEKVPLSFRGELQHRGLDAWNDLHSGHLYWFEGTRVLAISIEPPPPLFFGAVFPDPHVVYDDEGHGTATASVVARMCPDCWIVMVEVNRLDQWGLDWLGAEQQSWIDVVSRSISTLAHMPGNLTDGPDTQAAAMLAAVQGGRLFVNAGGNDPSPDLLDASGAPWVIRVGGARGDEHGPVPYTSQPVDVVADYLVHGLARNDSDSATWTADGTSFGAPLVAGVVGEAIYQLRNTTGQPGGIARGALVDAPGLRVTNLDLRRALNLTARYWNTTDYTPVVDPAQPIDLVDTANPALPAVPGSPLGPWLQMGWGYVDANTTQDIVRLLVGQAAPPAKQDAAAYMAQWDALRETVWRARQGLA